MLKISFNWCNVHWKWYAGM